jgi:hypothetical protein
LGISHDEFYALFSTVERTAIHLEMRDSYGTEVELPHLAKWASGEPDERGSRRQRYRRSGTGGQVGAR